MVQLVLFTFQAKPGREREFEALLNDASGGERVARGLGAQRNTLFLGNGRMVRVLEFPDGVQPNSLEELAKTSPPMAAFLRRLAPLIEDGFDPDDPKSLGDFNRRMSLPLAYDVRVPEATNRQPS